MNDSNERAPEGTREAPRSKRTIVIAMVAATVGLLAGVGFGWWQTARSGGPEVASPGGVVFLDIFATEDGKTQYKATAGLLTRPGEVFGAATKGSPHWNFVVCESKEDSVSPCGVAGPAPDEFGAVSVLWDDDGNVVGDWTPESERLEGE